ncbi:MAG: elongation factor G [Bacteroidales bacterium]|nr:elongation factor G [Bacteroidales bacterium]
MKVYQTNEIRNIALLGGAKSGKTTLAESMLFEGGIINRRGTIDDGNTVSDYREIELERGNSVSSTVMYTEFEGKKINIIDTPGFDDFVGEVVAALKVIEAGVVVVNAQNGVEVGTEIAWRNTAKSETPIIFAINHLEHENSNFDETIRQLKTQFGNNVTPCQIPVNVGLGFNSVVDLLQMKMFKFPENGGKPEILDIPANIKDKAEEMHAALLEELAAADEELMEIFFEKGALTEEQIAKGIKLGLISRTFFPVFCINAKQDMGVARLLQFIGDSVPAPNDAALHGMKTTEGKVLKCNSADPTVLFIFKTGMEQHLGEVVFFKVFAGEVTEGCDLYNSTTDTKERLTQLYVTFGKNREKVEKICAGDIGSTIKLKNSRTNTTITGLKNTGDVVEPIKFPASKIQLAVKAKNSADDEKLMVALLAKNRVDPTFTAEMSKELRQLIVGGQGELHLNIIKWQIENLDKVTYEFFSPKIPYRETITKKAKAMYRHKKQSGGSGQFGEVHMMIEPYTEGMSYATEFPIRGTDEYKMEWGGKLILNNCIVGGAIDARFIPAILKGIMEKMEEGPLTGSYARDVVVYIYDGKMHPVDSNELAFKLAGRNAFKLAFKDAGPKIMEPIYNVEVLVPEDKMGDVMTDLQGRRAVIMGMESEGNYQKLKAQVPLAEMGRYSTSLSSITSGRAMYSLEFAQYQQVPTDVQTKLLDEYKAQAADEE